jgi:hypothetical protein
MQASIKLRSRGKRASLHRTNAAIEAQQEGGRVGRPLFRSKGKSHECRG